MTSSTRQLRTEFADGSRLRWEFGNEDIGDRTPSQYAVISAIREEMRQLQARINALSIVSRRRARSRSPGRYHRIVSTEYLQVLIKLREKHLRIFIPRFIFFTNNSRIWL